MSCSMLKSITLPWRTAQPFTAHALLCFSRKLKPPHKLILVTMVLVLLALLEAASAKDEVLIGYNYDTLDDIKRDHAYVGDGVRFEVKSKYSDLVIAASSGFECELELDTVEYPMTNRNGTYSWTKSCIEENFYYYIRPRGTEQCKFGIVEVGTDGDMKSGENDNLPTSHSKMKSPITDPTEDNNEKCEEGFVKKDGECYESNYRMALIIVHSVVGGIIIGGLLVWFIVWRRRRRAKMSSEESALPKTPPTTSAGDASSAVVASAPTDIVIGGLSGAESYNAMSELNGEPRLGQALNAPAGVADAPSTEPSAPDISELVVKMDTDDPPTYEEATMPMRVGH